MELHNKTVMLVDDEAIILKTIASKLQNEGFTVLTASTGLEAIELLHGQIIHMVITDLMMPEMNGIELLKEIKEFNKEIAVIILTGYGDLNSAVDALRLGAEDYLLKPCDLNELLFRMSKCFENQCLREMVQRYEEILPICLECKRIRDDSHSAPGEGQWVSIEQYLTRTAGKQMSHGYCPECGNKILADIDEL